MKLVRLLTVLCCLAGFMPALTAQEEVTVTTSGGVITTIDPTEHRILLRAGETGDPTPFYYTEKTTIIDPDGRAVSVEALRQGVPATIYYAPEGGRMVVRRVVLSRTATQPPKVIEKQTTTTIEE